MITLDEVPGKLLVLSDVKSTIVESTSSKTFAFNESCPAVVDVEKSLSPAINWFDADAPDGPAIFGLEKLLPKSDNVRSVSGEPGTTVIYNIYIQRWHIIW